MPDKFIPLDNPPWFNEGRFPTPEEFTDWFTAADRDQQLWIAKMAIDNSERMQKCFMEDHAGAVKFARSHQCHTEDEKRILWLALDHSIGDCFLDDADVPTASKLHQVVE